MHAHGVPERVAALLDDQRRDRARLAWLLFGLAALAALAVTYATHDTERFFEAARRYWASRANRAVIRLAVIGVSNILASWALLVILARRLPPSCGRSGRRGHADTGLLSGGPAGMASDMLAGVLR